MELLIYKGWKLLYKIIHDSQRIMSVCWNTYLVVSPEGKLQELPTIPTPIQPPLAPITITRCQFQFQIQIQVTEREREKRERPRWERKEEVYKESGQTCHLVPPLWVSRPFHHCSFVPLYTDHNTDCMKIKISQIKIAAIRN